MYNLKKKKNNYDIKKRI